MTPTISWLGKACGSSKEPLSGSRGLRSDVGAGADGAVTAAGDVDVDLDGLAGIEAGGRYGLNRLDRLSNIYKVRPAAEENVAALVLLANAEGRSELTEMVILDSHSTIQLSLRQIPRPDWVISTSSCPTSLESSLTAICRRCQLGVWRKPVLLETAQGNGLISRMGAAIQIVEGDVEALHICELTSLLIKECEFEVSVNASLRVDDAECTALDAIPPPHPDVPLRGSYLERHRFAI
eukprot:CAMPEP_0170621654 /NCGR_PEP_ID=MMETSP0224-20130122/28713_1 /TAXON_ID=285029 /ORGANISM="Togula jolla, Strain CCCM 725" /LENGTH=236 /DNA_ID=CAMNT_0010947921 /DNA_START=102 /DNA_END=812 /DNA_ORIENTATION=+